MGCSFHLRGEIGYWTCIAVDHIYTLSCADSLAHYSDQHPISSITCGIGLGHLIAYYMGNSKHDGETSFPAAALVIVPPVLIVSVAIFAIKCSEWYPQLKGKILSWSDRSYLPCLRRRVGPDSAKAIGDPEVPIPLEGRISRRPQTWFHIGHLQPFTSAQNGGGGQIGVGAEIQ